MSVGQTGDEVARGDLADALVEKASALAVAVREETREEIAAHLSGLDRVELEALAVVLAAMIDPDKLLHEMLSWVDFDEYGNPAEPFVPRRQRSARERATLRPVAAAPVRIDWTAVNRALAGDPVELTQNERVAAVDVGIRSGMSKGEVGQALGMTNAAVGRAWERIKKKARAAGVFVPTEPAGKIRPHKVPHLEAV